ncbi:MAG TPA: lipoyl(octanoyl) transferase LipB [Candidatus Acidoferrales bacterium]|nr:lipoyl(octanoyl) transferase LipB [Candidatus Acidoferrales bacterium]
MNTSEKTCWVVDLGLIAYQPAFDLQRQLVAARKSGAVPDVLLLCEHAPVITLGRNGKQEHLLASAHSLRQMGVEFHPSDRGGDITYHGPGQIVGYPILNLAGIRRDVAWYVRQLEEAMIRATAEFGIVAVRKSGMTGVWVDNFREAETNAVSAGVNDAAPEKLAAIGVHLSRWVTSHGFAYNVSTDLRYFDLIVPCGIRDKRATSLECLLGRIVRREDVAPRIVGHLAEVLERDMRPVSREILECALQEHEEPAVHATA